MKDNTTMISTNINTDLLGEWKKLLRENKLLFNEVFEAYMRHHVKYMSENKRLTLDEEIERI